MAPRHVIMLWLAVSAMACERRAASPPAANEAQSRAASKSASPLVKNTSAASAAGAATVSFSDDEWKLLRDLAPERLPPPPADPSNAYADNPAAAALGETLFQERGFAGALLDADNDGGPNSLGRKGDTGKVSCAGCHLPKSGFSDTRSTFQEISLGTGWTARRTPSLLDVAQARLWGWGGRHSTLFGQIFLPLENPLEMNTSRLYVAQFLFAHYKQQYESVFGAGALDPLGNKRRFPALSAELTGCRLTKDVQNPRALPPDPLYVCHGVPGDKAEFDSMSKADRDFVTRVVVNMGKAIAAFQRTLSCGPGRFDQWVHGSQQALSAAEQRGLKLFIGRAGCVTCHTGPYFSDGKFHNVGVEERPTREGILNRNDRGAALDLTLAATDPLGIGGPYSDGKDDRLTASVSADPEGAFKTPGLRCVSARPSFMHSGLIPTLDGVIMHFSQGGNASGYPGKSVLKRLDLSAAERRELLAFLRTLDGKRVK